MTKPTKSMGARAALILAFVAAAGCGDDTIVTPTFGDGCTRDALAPGDTVTGALRATSCFENLHPWTWNRTPYESWRVTFQEGKGYLFYMKHSPDELGGERDDVDPMLTLFGKTEDGISVPLGFSDDEGDNYNSVLFFVAPRSGTFNLVASSYNDNALGGYTLTMQECPVLATLDSAGTYHFTLPAQAARCTRPGYPGGEEVVSYALLRVPVMDETRGFKEETLRFTVDAAAFDPFGEMFGAGFDPYGRLYTGSDYSFFAGIDTPGAITIRGAAGIATVAVGGVAGSSGAFTVNLGRILVGAPPAFVTGVPGAPTLRAEGPVKQPH